MTIFDLDPTAPHWIARIPTAEDLEQATEEQAGRWLVLNAHIGFIHTAWGNLENRLALLLAGILNIKIAQAEVVLASVVSNRAKRDVVNNSARITLAEEDRRLAVDRLMRRVSDAANKRNFIAHGCALYHQGYPDCITVMGYSPTLEPALSHYKAYTRQELLDIQAEIDAIASDLFDEAVRAAQAQRQSLPQTTLQELGRAPVSSANHHRPPRAARTNQPPTSPKTERPRKLSSAQKRALREKGDAST